MGFQRFELNLDALVELHERKPEGIHGVQFVRELRQELNAAGYDVLVSNELHDGLPGSIIIGAAIEHLGAKTHFYSVANRFEVPYHSSDFYSS